MIGTGPTQYPSSKACCWAISTIDSVLSFLTYLNWHVVSGEVVVAFWMSVADMVVNYDSTMIFLCWDMIFADQESIDSTLAEGL